MDQQLPGVEGLGELSGMDKGNIWGLKEMLYMTMEVIYVGIRQNSSKYTFTWLHYCKGNIPQFKSLFLKNG